MRVITVVLASSIVFTIANITYASYTIDKQGDTIVTTRYDKKRNKTILKVLDNELLQPWFSYKLDGFKFKKFVDEVNNSLIIEGFLGVGIKAVYAIDFSLGKITSKSVFIAEFIAENCKLQDYPGAFICSEMPQIFFWFDNCLYWNTTYSDKIEINSLSEEGVIIINPIPNVARLHFTTVRIINKSGEIVVYEHWFGLLNVIMSVKPELKNKIYKFILTLDKDNKVSRICSTLDLDKIIKNSDVKCEISEEYIICYEEDIKAANCKLWIFDNSGQLQAETRIEFTLKSVVISDSDELMVGIEEDVIRSEFDFVFELSRFPKRREGGLIIVDLSSGKVVKRIELPNNRIKDVIIYKNTIIGINSDGNLEIWSAESSKEKHSVIKVEW